MSIQQQKLVVDQFTKQAGVFASAQPIKDVEALDLLMKASGAGITDRTLDVACGPGIVACHFAAAVNHATGIDLTPAMIEQARALQHARGLTNVDWHVGEKIVFSYPIALLASKKPGNNKLHRIASSQVRCPKGAP